MTTLVPTLAAPLGTEGATPPLLVLAAMVIIVTIVALLRADKKDIPQIFASFATAFGFHRNQGHTSGTGASREAGQAQNARPIEDEEKKA
ncbi:hypothetical protein [Nocardia nova]|uniref:hypothetical protein n=1 Tax=Nocardia nova TaxID=37330 RepID=UPI001893CC1C|nr:hypothetical protein [Nocardia nova]MBF6278058.1 hypothetical protein [Nocardia nova]